MVVVGELCHGNVGADVANTRRVLPFGVVANEDTFSSVRDGARGEKDSRVEDPCGELHVWIPFVESAVDVSTQTHW